MIYVALAELVVIVFLIWVNQRERATHDATVQELVIVGVDERRELLTRIQRPEMVPAAPGAGPRQPPPPRDAVNLAKIGTVAVESTE